MEEGRPQQRQIGTAAQEGQGPPAAVEPMMMMIPIIPYQFCCYIHKQYGTLWTLQNMWLWSSCEGKAPVCIFRH